MNKVSFFIHNITSDLITALNASAPLSPVVAKDYVYNNTLGQFWIEQDENGFPVFCTYGTLFTNNILSLTDNNGNNPYNIEGKFYKDHPIHAPK